MSLSLSFLDNSNAIPAGLYRFIATGPHLAQMGMPPSSDHSLSLETHTFNVKFYFKVRRIGEGSELEGERVQNRTNEKGKKEPGQKCIRNQFLW